MSINEDVPQPLWEQDNYSEKWMLCVRLISAILSNCMRHANVEKEIKVEGKMGMGEYTKEQSLIFKFTNYQREPEKEDDFIKSIRQDIKVAPLAENYKGQTLIQLYAEQLGAFYKPPSKEPKDNIFEAILEIPSQVLILHN